MKNIGILLRGESLEQLPKICNEFEICITTNWTHYEYNSLGKYILGKKIIHYTTGKRCMESPEIFKKFNIDTVGMPVHKGGKEWMEHFRTYGVKEFIPVPKYIAPVFKNTGMTCMVHMSDKFKGAIIWMIGMDFYSTNYTHRKINQQRFQKVSRAMMKQFVIYTKLFSDNEYRVLTYKKGMPKLDNVRYIKTKRG